MDSSQDHRSQLRAFAEAARAGFTETHGVREQALRLSRQIIQNSANSIRATHRGEFQQAEQLVQKVASIAEEINLLRDRHPVIYYGGYVEDALKEYAEASATLAFATGGTLAGPEDLGMGPAPYLNGLADAVGELRRFILDSLRRGDFTRCEELLGLMDEVYTILVSMDFPEAVTRGLRRSTDMVRGTLERTRGDLTMALRQHSLEAELAAFQESLGNLGAGDESRP